MYILAVPLWYAVTIEQVFAYLRMRETVNKFLFWGKRVGKCHVSVLQFLNILKLLIPEISSRTFEEGMAKPQITTEWGLTHLWLGSVTSRSASTQENEQGGWGQWPGHPQAHHWLERHRGEEKKRIQIRNWSCIQTFRWLHCSPLEADLFRIRTFN